MRKLLTGILLLCLCDPLCACGGSHNADVTDYQGTSIKETAEHQEAVPENVDEKEHDNAMEDVEDKSMQLTIGDQAVSVEWEDNESIAALMELCADAPLSIQMSMYGDFEQVGSIGTNLPKDDKQTTTSAGDIVLYSGNQIVVFYGSNSWSYTRLGRITDLSNAELTELLGNEDVSVTISVN